MEERVQKLEAIAKDSIQKIQELKQEIEKLEAKCSELNQFKQKTLDELLQVRSTMIHEQREADNLIFLGEEEKKKRIELESLCEKQKYRINFLIKSLEEEERKK